MKLNEDVKIIGKNVILIPYEAKHVEKYHEWMKNPELQELTASEPLSLSEEYEMQKSWREDDDKCTFLILDKIKFNETNDEIISLIGDTNLFLQKLDLNQIEAEIEIMIAEKTARRKHFGYESLLLMINYGIEFIKCKSFIAKIGVNNKKSIKLFNKLKFNQIGDVNIFKEFTFGCDINSDWYEWLQSEIDFKIEKYNK